MDVYILISASILLFCLLCHEWYKYDKDRKQREQSFDDFCSCWAARQRRDAHRYLVEKEKKMCN